MTAAVFNAAEIGGAGASLIAVARELEAYALSADPTPSTTLGSRIVAAVAREVAPTPPVLFWRALRQGATAAALGYLVASTKAALGVGRMFPVAVRAQAIALILTVALVLAGSGAVLATGAATVLEVLAPRPAPQLPAVVDRSATPSPRATDREKPDKKPNDSKPGNGGAGAGPRDGSGDDRDDDRDEDRDEDDDDGHDRSSGSHEDESDGGHEGSLAEDQGRPDSDG